MNKLFIFTLMIFTLMSCGKDDEKGTDNRLFGQEPVAFYNQFASSFSGQGFNTGTPLYSHNLRFNNEVERDMGPNSRILYLFPIAGFSGEAEFYMQTAHNMPLGSGTWKVEGLQAVFSGETISGRGDGIQFSNKTCIRILFDQIVQGSSNDYIFCP